MKHFLNFKSHSSNEKHWQHSLVNLRLKMVHLCFKMTHLYFSISKSVAWRISCEKTSPSAPKSSSETSWGRRASARTTEKRNTSSKRNLYKKWAISSLFFIICNLFKQTIQFLQQINAKNQIREALQPTTLYFLLANGKWFSTVRVLV